MTVKELIEHLKTFDEELEVICERYSDLQKTPKEDFFVQRAVDKDFYVMRSHPTMSEENKSLERDYLCIKGN